MLVKYLKSANRLNYLMSEHFRELFLYNLFCPSHSCATAVDGAQSSSKSHDRVDFKVDNRWGNVCPSLKRYKMG